jgi:hypothetical protein
MYTMHEIEKRTMGPRPHTRQHKIAQHTHAPVCTRMLPWPPLPAEGKRRGRPRPMRWACMCNVQMTLAINICKRMSANMGASTHWWGRPQPTCNQLFVSSFCLPTDPEQGLCLLGSKASRSVCRRSDTEAPHATRQTLNLNTRAGQCQAQLWRT